jgi:hypothetical protein
MLLHLSRWHYTKALRGLAVARDGVTQRYYAANAADQDLATTRGGVPECGVTFALQHHFFWTPIWACTCNEHAAASSIHCTMQYCLTSSTELEWCANG